MRSAILVVSLLANVALGVWFVGRTRTVEPASAATSSASSAVESAGSQSASPKISAVDPASAAEVPAPLPDSAPAFHWSQLESTDYPEYIRKLRAFGVPDKTVRDIIFADVDKLYRPRFLALRPAPTTRTNFWEDNNTSNRPQRTREQSAQYRALQKEKTDLLKTLLGENVQDERIADSGGKAWFEREFDMVPAEHRDKVRGMRERYQEVTSEIYERAGGYHDMGIQAELRAARNKLYQELATVLSPQQLEDYKLRSSDIASNMRYELSKFEPNEEEFRSIYRYKEAMEAAKPDRDSDFDPPPPSSEEAKASRQKQKEAEDGLAAALGTERAKELKLMEQYDYRNLLDSGASKESVFRIAEMREEVEAAARKIRQDKSLSEDDRKTALAAMRLETENELKNLLGDRRARGFTANSGYWIRNISPRE